MSDLRYGLHAKRLVSELKTTQWLPPYNSELVSSICSEIRFLHSQIQEDLSKSVQDSSTALLSSVISRNKRCSLAYLNYRLGKLEKLKWDQGSAIPPHFYSQLHEDEIDYFRKYNSLVSSYSKSVSSFLDIATDIDPPKEVYIKTRVLETLGEIVLPESGRVNLQKGTVHLLRRSEAASLIKQGKLEHID